MNYRDYQVVLNPTALQNPYGRAFFRALGIVKDAYIQQGQAAVAARFPSQAPADALAAQGNERQVDQGVGPEMVATAGANETLAAYAQRIRQAWDLWVLGGTAWGLLKALATQGYTGAHLVQQNGIEWSLSAGNLVLTPRAPLTLVANPAGIQVWSLFAVWFPVIPTSWTSIANPPTAGSLPSLDEMRKIRRLIRRWKPAHAGCIGIAIPISGEPPCWGELGEQWGEGGAQWGAAMQVFSATDYPTWGYPANRQWGGTIPNQWNEQV